MKKSFEHSLHQSSIYLKAIWCIWKNIWKAYFPLSCHSPHQNSRGPLAQDGSVEVGRTSISHLVCISTIFVKQTSLYHVILLIKIQGVLLLKMDLWRIEEASISHLVCMYFMHTLGILKNFCSANFPLSCHSPHQDSRGPLAQVGSLEDIETFHKSFGMNFIHTWCILKNFC